MKTVFLLCFSIIFLASVKGQDSFSKQQSDSLSAIFDRPGSFLDKTENDTIICAHCRFVAVCARVSYFSDSVTKQLVKVESVNKFISEKKLYQQETPDSVSRQYYYFINQRLFKAIAVSSDGSKNLQNAIYYYSGNKMDMNQNNSKTWALMNEKERLNYNVDLYLRNCRR